MKCDNFLLEGYVDQFLSIAERLEVEKHLQTCASCQEELQRLELQQLELLRQLEAPMLTKSFADDIMAQIDSKQHIKKKQRWIIPFVTAATLFLAFGLVALNKESLFSETEVTLQQPTEQIVFENIQYDVGQLEVTVAVEDEDGNFIKPSEIAHISVFTSDHQNISENIKVLVSNDNVKQHYVVAFDQMYYEDLQVEFHYKKQNVKDVLILEQNVKKDSFQLENLMLDYYGYRVVNNNYEIFYKTRFTKELQSNYQTLDEQLNAYTNNPHKKYRTHMQIGLSDANGLTILGETNGIAKPIEGVQLESYDGAEIGETSYKLTVPQEAGQFPMSLNVNSLFYSHPILEKHTVNVNETTYLNMANYNYEVNVSVQKLSNIVIEIKSDAPFQNAVTDPYVKIGERFVNSNNTKQNLDGMYFSTITIENVESIPKTLELLFTRKDNTIEFEQMQSFVIQ